MPRQAGLHARVVRNILLVIVIDEFMPQGRQIQAECDQRQPAVDQALDSELCVACPHDASMMRWIGIFSMAKAAGIHGCWLKTAYSAKFQH
jgi:hypothetical protein